MYIFDVQKIGRWSWKGFERQYEPCILILYKHTQISCINILHRISWSSFGCFFFLVTQFQRIVALLRLFVYRLFHFFHSLNQHTFTMTMTKLRTTANINAWYCCWWPNNNNNYYDNVIQKAIFSIYISLFCTLYTRICVDTYYFIFYMSYKREVRNSQWNRYHYYI